MPSFGNRGFLRFQKYFTFPFQRVTNLLTAYDLSCEKNQHSGCSNSTLKKKIRTGGFPVVGTTRRFHSFRLLVFTIDLFTYNHACYRETNDSPVKTCEQEKDSRSFDISSLILNAEGALEREYSSHYRKWQFLWFAKFTIRFIGFTRFHCFFPLHWSAYYYCYYYYRCDRTCINYQIIDLTFLSSTRENQRFHIFVPTRRVQTVRRFLEYSKYWKKKNLCATLLRNTKREK